MDAVQLVEIGPSFPRKVQLRYLVWVYQIWGGQISYDIRMKYVRGDLWISLNIVLVLE